MSTTFPFIVTEATVSVGASGNATRRSSTLVDVLMTHTQDGGEIEYVNGVATMSDGLFNAAYISLFGGNEQDSGLPVDLPVQWWGNAGETDAARVVRSETQFLLLSIPAIPANLQRVQEAAERDLGWMVSAGLATFVSVLVTMPGLRRARIDINIEVADKRFELAFESRWGAAN